MGRGSKKSIFLNDRDRADFIARLSVFAEDDAIDV